MKKLLFILFLMSFIPFKGFSQSKAVTINWIIQKTNDYGTFANQKIISATNDGIISYSYEDKFLPSHFHFIVINLNDVTEVTLGINTPSDRINNRFLSLVTKGNRVSETFKNQTSKRGNALLFFDEDKNTEKDLFIRILKAFSKLVEYNNSEILKEPF